MSGPPRVRSMNTTESNLENEARPVLVPGGNKKPVGLSRKLTVKPTSPMLAVKPPTPPTVKPTTPKQALIQPNRPLSSNEGKREKPRSCKTPPSKGFSRKVLLKGHDLLLHPNLSLNASCSSDVSMESFSSRASTGRIGRQVVGPSTRLRVGLMKREKTVAVKPENGVRRELTGEPGVPQEKRRCPWITANSESSYTAFHDEEWGVPVHDDKRLFELLVLCGALAELTWPEILSKRQNFREAFVGFDPLAVSKLNEKKSIMPGEAATPLLSETKIRAIIDNSRQMLKIIEEFGSFDRYCWNFVNQKPVINKFKYPRQVPVKSPKADLMSKDLIKRGFRSVGPTVVYSFMQAAGLANDHLTSCFRHEECAAIGTGVSTDPTGETKNNDEVSCTNLTTTS